MRKIDKSKGRYCLIQYYIKQNVYFHNFNNSSSQWTTLLSGGTLLVFDVTLNPIQVLDHTEDYMEVSMEITTIVARIGVEKKPKKWT